MIKKILLIQFACLFFVSFFAMENSVQNDERKSLMCELEMFFSQYENGDYTYYLLARSELQKITGRFGVNILCLKPIRETFEAIDRFEKNHNFLKSFIKDILYGCMDYKGPICLSFIDFSSKREQYQIIYENIKEIMNNEKKKYNFFPEYKIIQDNMLKFKLAMTCFESEKKAYEACLQERQLEKTKLENFLRDFTDLEKHLALINRKILTENSFSYDILKIEEGIASVRMQMSHLTISQEEKEYHKKTIEARERQINLLKENFISYDECLNELEPGDCPEWFKALKKKVSTTCSFYAGYASFYFLCKRGAPSLFKLFEQLNPFQIKSGATLASSAIILSTISYNIKQNMLKKEFSRIRTNIISNMK